MKKTYFSKVGNCLKMLLKKGVDEGVFSGAAAGVYKHSTNRDEKLIVCHGETKKNCSNSRPINENTLFDLASLTKPLCTVLTTIHLIEQGKISLDTRIDALFETKTPQILKNIKIKNLLSHSAGFIDYEPFYLYFKPEQKTENKKRLLKYILNEKPVYEPGEKCVYSDFGFILLGEIIEKVSEKKIDENFTSAIVEPLGLDKELLFRPIGSAKNLNTDNIAATQKCPWRNRLLQGEVDDEHCWLMNGVAGHAGLFGTVHGVLRLTAYILNQWTGRQENQVLNSVLLNKILSKQYKDQTWCLGFDTPSPSGSSAGKYISRESVGHLGFTGTSFWIDPVKELVVVLLTNRIYPSRENEKIKQFRPLFHNTVCKALKNS